MCVRAASENGAAARQTERKQKTGRKNIVLIRDAFRTTFTTAAQFSSDELYRHTIPMKMLRLISENTFLNVVLI